MSTIPDSLRASTGSGHGRLERKTVFDEKAWLERRRLAGKSVATVNTASIWAKRRKR